MGNDDEDVDGVEGDEVEECVAQIAAGRRSRIKAGGLGISGCRSARFKMLKVRVKLLHLD